MQATFWAINGGFCKRYDAPSFSQNATPGGGLACPSVLSHSASPTFSESSHEVGTPANYASWNVYSNSLMSSRNRSDTRSRVSGVWYSVYRLRGFAA